MQDKPSDELPEIRAISREIVYRNKWMTVREDGIVRGDGSTGIYGVVEKPDFVVIAAVQDGAIHLVEQFRYPVGARYWEMPQGTWDSHTDPAELAAAELREETGLIAGRLQHAGRLFLAYGMCTQAYNVFLATDLTQGERELDAEEHGLVCRVFPLETFEQMMREGVIPDASTVAAYGLLKLKGLL